MGSRGVGTCLLSSVLSMVAPIPCFWPSLCCLRLIQRRRIRHLYHFPTGDRVPFAQSALGDDLAVLCCPACALSQEIRFLEAEAKEGILRFPWESGTPIVKPSWAGEVGGADGPHPDDHRCRVLCQWPQGRCGTCVSSRTCRSTRWSSWATGRPASQHSSGACWAGRSRPRSTRRTPLSTSVQGSSMIMRRCRPGHSR